MAEGWWWLRQGGARESSARHPYDNPFFIVGVKKAARELDWVMERKRLAGAQEIAEQAGRLAWATEVGPDTYLLQRRGE